MKCPECNGQGYWVEQYDTDYGPEWSEGSCQACYGVGKVPWLVYKIVKAFDRLIEWWYSR